jgi:hypothetical protein
MPADREVAWSVFPIMMRELNSPIYPLLRIYFYNTGGIRKSIG